MPVDVKILGPIEAHRDGEWINVGGARQRRLLALLALTPSHTRGLDSAVAAMWPDPTGPIDTKASVHTAVSRIRHALGDASMVVTHGGGYALQNVVVDATRFAELAEIGRKDPDPGSRAETLRAALSLWRGAALEEFAHEDWARPDAVKLDELRAHVADEFGLSLMTVGQSGEAMAELQAAAARSPIRERTHRILMQALDQSGRQAEALRTYQTYRHRLATDVGLEPGEEIRSLESAIATGTNPRTPIERSNHFRGLQEPMNESLPHPL
jgi:DNA-binding SARP family transcriptional activator